MKTKLAALIEVRKLIALLFAVVFCYLAVAAYFNAMEILPIFTMVFGFYFGRSTALDKPKE